MIDHPGVHLMHVEMARQCGDALASMQDAKPGATLVAQASRDAGRLVLYGIGGSHYVNRMVEPLYRAAGIECRAMSPSEALMAPLPDARRVALYVSQSGESGEIVELLARPAAQDRRFGITLNPGSTLGRSVELAIVGAGGPENAFAATRSIVLTLAIHGAILEALGQGMDGLRAVFAADAPAEIGAVDAALVGSEVILFSGRHVMQGVAQSAALSLMELARVPAIGLELGQFRHGPFEFLRPGVAIVLLRSAGPDGPSVAPVAQSALDAGCTTVVFDAADGKLPAGCVCLALPRSAGLAAAAHMLLALQRLNIAVALRRIPTNVGAPLRTSKVTL
jgi:fructoselysine-6-P-deglycase FrlB-like protein